MPGGTGKMLVRKIEEGTVLDHIPVWRAVTVAKVLGLDRLSHSKSEVSVAILQNVESKSHGKKDIIKIDHWHVDEKDADIVSLVFPEVTINYIKKWVVAKYHPQVPDAIEGRIKCPELLCISNTEREPAMPRFRTLKKERLLQCQYCDTLLGFDMVPEHVRT